MRTIVLSGFRPKLASSDQLIGLERFDLVNSFHLQIQIFLVDFEYPEMKVSVTPQLTLILSV